MDSVTTCALVLRISKMKIKWLTFVSVLHLPCVVEWSPEDFE